mgnify:CR=1 FL=1
MAEFKQVVITHKGQALMSKLMSGKGNANFTAIRISDTSYNDNQLEELTEIGNIKQEVPISKVTRTNDVAVQIEGAISNIDLKTGYYMRTLGLFAKDPDEGEILYAVTVASQAGYMPPYNGRTTSGAFFRLVTTIGNAENVTLQVNPSAVATIGDVQDLQEQVDELKGIVGYTDDDVFGLEVDYENNKFTRLAGAKNRQPGNDFDNLGPWMRRRCIMTRDDNKVLAYYGEPGYETSGSLTKELTKNGVTYPVGTEFDVMVEQPKFYYRVVPLKTEKTKENGTILKKARYYVSSTSHIGFKVHPAFITNINSKKTEHSKIYLSAYNIQSYQGSAIGSIPSDGSAGIRGERGGLKKFLDETSIKPQFVQTAETISMTKLLHLVEYANFITITSEQNAAATTLRKKYEKQTNASQADMYIMMNEILTYRGETSLMGHADYFYNNMFCTKDKLIICEPISNINSNLNYTESDIKINYDIDLSKPFSDFISYFIYGEDIDWLFFPAFIKGNGNSQLPIGAMAIWEGVNESKIDFADPNNLLITAGPQGNIFGIEQSHDSSQISGRVRLVKY